MEHGRTSLRGLLIEVVVKTSELAKERKEEDEAASSNCCYYKEQ